MKLLRRRITFLLFCGFMAVFGCATTQNTNTEVAPVSVPHEEFINGVTVSIFELIQIFGSYYHENSALPESFSILQEHAVKNNISLHAQGISEWRVSGPPQVAEITFQIISPAYREASGENHHSLEVEINKVII